MIKDETIFIRKKNGTLVEFNGEKIENAITKSADRILVELSFGNKKFVVDGVYEKCKLHCVANDTNVVSINDIHLFVEDYLTKLNKNVAESYKSYRNWKVNFANTLDKVFTKKQALEYVADRQNANTDAALVSTKSSITYNYLNKEFYQQFFLNKDEREAIEEGYIYIHDMDKRLDTINCCLFDIENVLKGGFEMGNLTYTEPKTLDVAMDVISDIILAVASQQYGEMI